MHAHYVQMSKQEALALPALTPSSRGMGLGIILVGLGIGSFLWGLNNGHEALAWGSFYVSLLFFMGLSFGGVVLTIIFQIVRAKWSATIRRLAEANVAFLPVAFAGLLLTYAGRHHLFPWANAPRPGTEWWMQPLFVYLRIGCLFLLLIGVFWSFVKLSLRGDFGLAKEEGDKAGSWQQSPLRMLASRWRGSEVEVPIIQNKLSRRAPALIFVYALIYSLFAFEMVMATDAKWLSNLFGAFLFVGNVYMAWAVLGISTFLHTRSYGFFKKASGPDQMWDLGKLLFGFCMIWGYFFLSQFLPQWYGNLPEETQWLILRTRELPWKGWGWVTLSCCFFVPFIILLSEDVKRHPLLFPLVCVLILVGKWMEAYLLIIPQLSPGAIPFQPMDIGIFLGFLGAYLLAIRTFLANVPPVSPSHPLTRGSNEW